MIDLATAPRTRLFTAWGTVLYFDNTSGDLRHGPVETSPANAYFAARPSSVGAWRKGWLICESGGTRPIVCLVDRCYPISLESGEASDTPTLLELIPLERGLIAFHTGGVFLSAIPDGRIHLSAPVCSSWELFLASQDWCTNAPGCHEQIRHSDIPRLDKNKIADYIIHPLIRTKATTNSAKVKVLIYGYTQWSHGRIYYDLCTQLHSRGYIVDILDWRVNHADYIKDILPYYDLYMTALDGVSTLVDSYCVPYDRIIAVSHHELDKRMLIEQKGLEVFEKFASYVATSEFIYCASLMHGVPRAPVVASIGINFSEFFSEIPEYLTTVGYASSISVETYGIEWKRGKLAEAAAREAGLAFKVAGSTADQISFHDMPNFYRSVGAVLTSSISEAAQLPIMEAAAAGRLVIGTPVGHFPRRAYQGGGIMAPVEAEKFKTFTSDTLRYYKENRASYVDKCRTIQEAARKFDWQYSIEEWIDLIEEARPHRECTSRIGGPQRCTVGTEVLEKPPPAAAFGSAAVISPIRKNRAHGTIARVQGSGSRAIICDIKWLRSYIATEHYHFVRILHDEFGFDIIDSKETDFDLDSTIVALNAYKLLIIAWQGSVRIPTSLLSAYSVFKIDDLENYNSDYTALIREIARHSSMLIGPYAYEMKKFFPHRDIVWIPYSTAVEEEGGVLPFNSTPFKKILLSGSVAWDRPFRKHVFELEDERLEKLSHPGYWKKYDKNSTEIVRNKWFTELNKYLCCFCDAHSLRYIHLRMFEIPSVGALLLADRLVEKEMNELGFHNGKTCIFCDPSDFVEKISWILDDANRASVDKIRTAGMQLTLERHTTRHRVSELVSLLNLRFGLG